MIALKSKLSEFISLDAEGEAWMDKRLLDKLFSDPSAHGLVSGGSGGFAVHSAGGERKGGKKVKTGLDKTQFGNLSMAQWQMILDAIDVDGAQHLVSLGDFFSAVHAWKKTSVQALDLFALKVNVDKVGGLFLEFSVGQCPTLCGNIVDFDPP